MNKKIAVTGASGHLGNVVCRQLIEKGYSVKAFYRSDSESIRDLPLELVQGDVLVKGDLEKLVDGCEVVINCAAVIGINGDPTGLIFKTNTEGPKKLLEVAIEKGVKRIVHVSSVHAVMEVPAGDVFDESRPYKKEGDYPYDYSKALGEQILLKAKDRILPEILVLRPSCIVGPYDFKPSEFGKALIKFYYRKIPLLPEGGFDFVDVRDVAASVVNAVEKGRSGEIYLVSGKYYSMKALAFMIQQVTGIKTPGTTMPYWFMKILLPLVLLYSWITKSPPLFTQESIDALYYGHPKMDHKKAMDELDHHSRPLEETLKDFYTWQKATGKFIKNGNRLI